MPGDFTGGFVKIAIAAAVSSGAFVGSVGTAHAATVTPDAHTAHSHVTPAASATEYGLLAAPTAGAPIWRAPVARAGAPRGPVLGTGPGKFVGGGQVRPDNIGGVVHRATPAKYAIVLHPVAHGHYLSNP